MSAHRCAKASVDGRRDALVIAAALFDLSRAAAQDGVQRSA
jgi:hypothetical protein